MFNSIYGLEIVQLSATYLPENICRIIEDNKYLIRRCINE